MAERDGKKGKAKGKAKPEASVLGSLPDTRTPRMGRPRGAETAAPPRPRAAAKPRAATPQGAEPAGTTAARKPARPAATRKPAEPAGTTAARKPARPAATRKPAEPAAPPAPGRPRPVRAGAPTLSGTPAPEDRPDEDSGPSGTELVGTVLQAAGELSRIGLTVGGQVLRRVAGKLPRP